MLRPHRRPLVGDTRKDPAQGQLDISIVPPAKFQGTFIPTARAKSFRGWTDVHQDYSVGDSLLTETVAAHRTRPQRAGDPFRFQAFLTENGKMSRRS